MKKLLTILMVLVLVAGFAFADGETTYTSGNQPKTSGVASNASETHKIIVRSDVGEVLPVFNLAFGSAANTNSDKDAAGAVFGAATNDVRTVGTETENGAVYIGFSLNENGQATFTATVLKGKMNRIFDLEFSDGVFAVRRGGNPQGHSPEKIVTAAGAGGTGVSAALGAAAGHDGDGNKKITVTFDGKTVNGSATVATATYYYLGDDTIDATDVNHITESVEDDWYYATIQMTVTAR